MYRLLPLIPLTIGSFFYIMQCFGADVDDIDIYWNLGMAIYLRLAINNEDAL